MPWPNKRRANLPSPHPIGPWSCCSTSPGSLPLGLCRAPVPHWIHTLLWSPPLRLHRTPAPRWIQGPQGSPWPWALHPSGLLGPSSVWDDQSHAPPGSLPLRPCRIPAPPESLPVGPSQALALQACQITAPPGSHSGCHWRAPILPKWHSQTGLDAKGVTSEQLRLQFYCSRTGDFFFPSLRVWLSGLLFDHSPSLPFISIFALFLVVLRIELGTLCMLGKHSTTELRLQLPSLPFKNFFVLSFFYLSFSFSFLSFSLGFVSINIVTQLILNYT
jgi:hypothetical protein